MKLQVLSSVLAASTLATAAAIPSKNSTELCEKPSKRNEWRQLKPEDQQSYLDSVLCLKTKPSRQGLNSTLYDDFAHIHFELNTYSELHIHWSFSL